MDKPDRTILHCDCNSFFASVEAISHPEYRKVPMAVAGDPASRHGIILAKNELAKAYHVQTAETIWQARRKCPRLLIVPAHHEEYAKVSELINKIYLEYTDQVEPFSIDESWLDVTGSRKIRGDGKKIADELRYRVRTEIGVTISVGVSFNKSFAKFGSDYKKPDATTVISRDNYRAIVWAAPIEDLLFVGKAAAREYRGAGILTIGDLARMGREKAERRFGRGGISAYEIACGLDEASVARYDDYTAPKSISRMETYAHDLTGTEEIRTGLLALADDVGTRLRREGLYARTVTVQVKDPGLSVRQHQRKLKVPSDLTKDIYEEAYAAVLDIWRPGQPVRMLTVGVSGFTKERHAQAGLFDEEPGDGRQEDLEQALDRIRERYGDKAVGFARTRDK